MRPPKSEPRRRSSLRAAVRNFLELCRNKEARSNLLRCGRSPGTCTVELEHEEALLVFDENCMSTWELQEEFFLDGELFKAHTVIARVGKKEVPKFEKEARQLIDACFKTHRPLRVQFRTPRIPFPWCMVLRWPCLTIWLNLAWVGALLAAGIHSFEMDTSTDSFMDSDGIASLKFNTLRDARVVNTPSSRRLHADADSEGLFPVQGEPGESRRLQSTRLFKSYTFNLIFATQGNGHVLEHYRLKEMRDFENRIRSLQTFQDLCGRSHAWYIQYCNPGITLTSVVFATLNSTSNSTALGPYYRLDGGANQAIPLEVAVHLARQSGVAPAVLPKNVSQATLTTQSYVTCQDEDPRCQGWANNGRCTESSDGDIVYMRDFCPAACGYCSVGGPAGLAPDTVKLEVVRTVFYFQAFCCLEGPKIKEDRQKLDKMYDDLLAEVSETIMRANISMKVLYEADNMQMLEAFRALSKDLIWGLVSYLFVSLYATIYLRSLLLSVVGLFFILLSIPAALSIFTMISGVGKISLMNCLSVFIVIGVGSDMLFVYSDFWTQSIEYNRDKLARIKFVYKQAASSTMATTFTTAMSFFSNLASVLRPLREFGFFMGTCVAVAWLLVFLSYPALLILGDRCRRRSQRVLMRKAAPSDSSNILGMVMSTTTTKFVGMLDPEGTKSTSDESGFLGKYYSPFIRRFRWLILLAFVVLTVWSGWMCMANAQQDSEVPQIFPASHPVTQVKAYTSTFEAFQRVPLPYPLEGIPSQARYCTTLYTKGCLVNACPAVALETRGSPSSCECFLHELNPAPPGCPMYTYRLAVIGGRARNASLDELRRAVIEALPASRGSTDDGKFEAGFLYSMHWESGREHFGASAFAPVFARVPADDAALTCSGALFHGDLLAQREVGEVAFNGTSDVGLDALCCRACAATSTCEFWVREPGVDGEKTCWLRRGPLRHVASNSIEGPNLRVGWRPGPGRLGSVAQFVNLTGVELTQVLLSGSEAVAANGDADKLDSICCRTCGATSACSFWLRTGEVCRLMSNPGSYVGAGDCGDAPSVANNASGAAGVGGAGQGVCPATRGGWPCKDPSYFSTSRCEERWSCYCGLPPCEGTNLAEPRGRLRIKEVVARRLQADSVSVVPPNQQATVSVVLGLEVTNSNPILGESSGQKFGYLANFRLEDPWSQRKALSLCTEFPGILKVVSFDCWLLDFSRWWETAGGSWPVRDSEPFYEYVDKFLKTTDGTKRTRNVWIVDGRVRGMFADVKLDFSTFGGGKKAYELMQLWDAHFDAFNAEAEDSVRGAWHTSSLWVRAEAEKVIIDSTLVTIGISLLFVVAGVGIFTRSIVLSLIVMVTVTAVIVCLLFFMVVIMGWKIGAIEVLSLIIFVGFAVDYSFHIAHKYHSCQVTALEEPDEVVGATSTMSGVDDGREPIRSSGRSGRSSKTSDGSKVRFSLSEVPHRNQRSNVSAELRKENTPAERYHRTKYALTRMGSSVMSSAVTTIGCAAFLLPCTIFIFFKIGAVVVGVTAYAVLYALIPLPAGLMVIGPANHNFKSVADLLLWLGTLFSAVEEHEEEEQDGDRHHERRYVLHMPTYGVAAHGERPLPTRTTVTAGG